MVDSQRPPVIEWVPYRTTWQKYKPHGARWSTHSTIIPEYTQHLSNLGLTDPTTAADGYARAVELRDASEVPISGVGDHADIVARLASGDLTPAQAAKLTREDPKEIQRRAIDNARYLSIASETALGNAIASIHSFGEDKWMAILKPIATKAIAAKDQTRFDLVHGFARFLRRPDIAGLAAAMVDNARNTDADPDFYMFGRPDLVYLWRVDQSDSKQLRLISTETIVDNWWRIAYELKRDAPFPTIRQFQPEWKPGLYSAQEAIDNKLISREEHERAFQKLVPDVPTQKRRVTVI